MRSFEPRGDGCGFPEVSLSEEMNERIDSLCSVNNSRRVLSSPVALFGGVTVVYSLFQWEMSKSKPIGDYHLANC